MSLDMRSLSRFVRCLTIGTRMSTASTLMQCNRNPPSSSLFGESPLATSRHLVPTRRFCDQPSSATSFHVQDYEDFKERVLQSSTPVVVDFFADWCGPCKLLAPRLESMVDRKNGSVILAKVNVDDCTELAMEYGVRSVPTVIAFKDGQPIDQMIGLTEDEEIKSFLNKLTNE